MKCYYYIIKTITVETNIFKSRLIWNALISLTYIYYKIIDYCVLHMRTYVSSQLTSEWYELYCEVGVSKYVFFIPLYHLTNTKANGNSDLMIKYHLISTAHSHPTQVEGEVLYWIWTCSNRLRDPLTKQLLFVPWHIMGERFCFLFWFHYSFFSHLPP